MFRNSFELYNVSKFSYISEALNNLNFSATKAFLLLYKLVLLTKYLTLFKNTNLAAKNTPPV